MGNAMSLLVAFVLLLGVAFFVGAQIALVSVRQAQMAPLAEAGQGRARTTMAAMSNVPLMLVGAQLGKSVCSLGIGATAEPALANMLASGFGAVGVSEAWVEPVAFTLALAIVVAVHSVLGELVPKNIALAEPSRTAMALEPALYRIVTAVRPVLWILNETGNRILRLLGVTPREAVAATDLDGVRGIVRESYDTGTLDGGSTGLVERTLDLPALTAGDLHLPLADVRMLDPADDTDELYRASIETGYSRFPLVGDQGQPFAYVHIRDAVVEPESEGSWVLPGRVGDLPLRPLAILSADLPLIEVFGRMTDAATHMAKVVDDDNHSLGILTLEDALQQLIGTGGGATQRPDGGTR